VRWSKKISFRVPVLLIWFVVLWESLWGRFSFANLLSGVLVSIGLVLLVRLPDTPFRSYGGARIRPLRTIWYGIYFVFKVVQANVLLAWEVVTPRNTIKPGILGIRLRDCSDALITLIANSFTLTPGSLTIEVTPGDDTTDPDTIYVHVLHLNDPAKVRADLMHLAELAVRAFGTEQALEQFRTPHDANHEDASYEDASHEDASHEDGTR
jgi:multicomponent Na+:H+ antiporter subunit E